MAINNLERLHRKGRQSPVHSNVGSIIVAKVTNSAEVPSPENYFTTNEINAKWKTGKKFREKLLMILVSLITAFILFYVDLAW